MLCTLVAVAVVVAGSDGADGVGAHRQLKTAETRNAKNLIYCIEHLFIT